MPAEGPTRGPYAGRRADSRSARLPKRRLDAPRVCRSADSTSPRLVRSGAGGAAGRRRGAVVWACALVGGMLLRRLTGDGTAWSFVLVATAFLGALLLGWRLLARLLPSRRP